MGSPDLVNAAIMIAPALNASYMGRSRKDTLLLLPNGSSFPRRARSKVLAGHRGWRGVAAALREHGAPLISEDADVAERAHWLAGVERTLLRRTRHPGNHRYAFGLDKGARRGLQGGTYPKLERRVA